jgi:P-type Cu+ transporter
MNNNNNKSYTLRIQGMSCGHCSSKVTKISLNVSGVTAIDIDLEQGKALVQGGNPSELAQIISDAGYPAQILTDTPESCVIKTQAKLVKNPPQQELANKTLTQQKSYTINIEDMTCSSCVARVEKTIKSVAGVTEAAVNLIEKSAQVVGGDQQQVIDEINNHGYKASLNEQHKACNNYQFIIMTSNKNQVSQILSPHATIQKMGLINSNSDIQLQVQLTTKQHPAKLLALFKQADIKASINEQYADPYADLARKSKIEIKQSWQRAFVAALVGSALMIGQHMGLLPQLNTGLSNNQIHTSQIIWFLIALICLFTMWFSGRNYYINAIKQAKHFSSNMDTLVAMGTSAAWLSSLLIIINPDFIPGGGHLYLDAAVFILAFLQFGHALETQAKRTTSESIASIVELAPKNAMLLVGDIEVDFPVSMLQLGDTIKVKPGERIAIDGIINSGLSTVDESMLTGEPLAMRKQVGDLVTGGTINKSGSFTFKVSKKANETTLSQIISMVKQAQISKPEIGRTVDKIASVFVPIVISIAILTFVLWFFIGPQPHTPYALTTAIAVLVIACPCALGLATPIAIMMGTSKAAQYNILIKNSDALQTASTLTHLVVDKTGTLTQGNPTVSNIIINPQLNSTLVINEDQILELSASLEKHSEHPLAEAIINAASKKEIQLKKVEQFLSVEGKGIQAVIDGQTTLLGNYSFMQENSIDISPEMIKQAEQLAELAATPIWLAKNGQLWGLLGLKDLIRKDSHIAIKMLQEQNITVVMCTGDAQKTAQAVAKELAIVDIHSEVMPKDKLLVIKGLQAKGYKVGMVGDGVNDAPALAQADTGFAIGSGTDVAIENADITLAGNSLVNVSSAIAISTATIKNIKQNLFGAFIYNIIGIPLAAGLFYPITGWLLAPAFASAAMAMSSVTVVANANRLRFFKAR